jgi:ankyrin repeat protein
VNKRLLVAAVLAVLLAASAYAQATDLTRAVLTGTPHDVQAAIDRGADVNAYHDDMTPLLTPAAYNKNPQVISTLLRAEANIEARDLNPVGATPLLWAAYANQNPEVVTMLLKAGADIKAQDTVNGRTALIWAVHDNLNPEIITTLLRAGADTKVKDKSGYTALDYAHNRSALKGTDALKQLEEASK